MWHSTRPEASCPLQPGHEPWNWWRLGSANVTTPAEITEAVERARRDSRIMSFAWVVAEDSRRVGPHERRGGTHVCASTCVPQHA